MSKVVNVDLYKTSTPQKKSDNVAPTKKMVLSLVISALIVAFGVGTFVFFKAYESRGAVNESPTGDDLGKRPEVRGSEIAQRMLDWQEFVKGMALLYPGFVVSDGENGFLAGFVVENTESLAVLTYRLSKFTTGVSLLDTSTTEAGMEVVLKGNLKKTAYPNPPQPVDKILIPKVMLLVDSLAEASGLVNISREVLVSDEDYKYGKRTLYTFTASGEHGHFARFVRKLNKLDYALSPNLFLWEVGDSFTTMRIVWSIHSYTPEKDTTNLADAASKKKK